MTERSFLFLQGPHGRFFSDLAGVLCQAGCKINRIGFNAGDAFFWKHKDCYTPFVGAGADWSEFLKTYLDKTPITDLVLYGDTREIHATARALATERGIKIHCFEEGYLRPYWITYEQNGVNGNSPLMDMSIEQIRMRLQETEKAIPEAPAQWGALWHHIYLGAIYHWLILFMNRRYSAYKSHRDVSVAYEWWLHIQRLTKLPFTGLVNRRKARQLETSGANYHVVLMQLAHDTSFVEHSDFGSVGEFVELVMRGFAKGAPKHHKLVFKFHPLEDGRANLPKLLRDSAERHGIARRVVYLDAGKLGPLLDRATSAVTVNSTAGQQALWRGMPLRIFGRCVYDKPELVSSQPIDQFFALPRQPDRTAYLDFRQYLLETSQFTGGFYTARGRAQVLREVVEVMLHDLDPYVAWPVEWPFRRVLHGERGE